MPSRNLIPEESAVVDEAALARLTALAAEVAEAGEDLVGELFRTFTVDARTRIAALRVALAQDAFTEAADAVHALKGASSTLGALRLAALCAALERSLRAGEPAPEDAPTQLEEELERALAAVARGLAGSGAEP